ncbi:TonB-dependent receptor [candidate division KSB1 bacterium]|nr:TonB-dependent receptor [candidate division KSB1 bacterium]
MKASVRQVFIALVIIALPAVLLQAQTTGKIAGSVVDKKSGEPLPGANVFIEGTQIGAATDQNGEFFIINVPPGSYKLVVQMMGYSKYEVTNLRVSVNRTTHVKAELLETILEGETIVVKAEKIVTKKDQTSSIRNVSSEQIELLPVEDINSVVNLQAGIVNGHFRGGRRNEVSFMIDGIQVIEAFAGENSAVDIEKEVVEELEVITGTFNAEYGRAMSGVVNAVTKDGSNTFQGAFSSSYANYYTSHDNIFIGLDNSQADRQKDTKFQLSGPVLKDRLMFFMNVRLQDNEGYLNAIHRFNVNDYSGYLEDNSLGWISLHTGDSSFVPLSYSKLNSYMGKLTSTLFSNLKLSLLFTRNDERWRDYDHNFKYNPYGLGTNYKETDMYTFLLNHMISPKIFYDIKLSYFDNYYGYYVFKNPLDSRYVHDSYLTNVISGFYTGGQQKSHTERTLKDYNAKFDLTWQFNQRHLIKGGVLLTQHDLDHSWHEIQNAFKARLGDQDSSYYDFSGVMPRKIYPNYEPMIDPDSSTYTDAYHVKPYEFSAYVQDKMEFDQMVVNIGVRFDYFNANTVYPSQRRNPANQSNEYLRDENGHYVLDSDSNLVFDPERMSKYPKTKPQIQISPRFGLSYTLGNAAVLHFSYGHFFQMPALQALYQNHSFSVAPSDYATTMGNSQLQAQNTIQYEVGLWQELIPNLGLEVIVFYRDIYNLLSTKVVSTYNQTQYGLHTNKDYGNVKGMELKIDYMWGHLSTHVNYTLQYTRGNADNPTQTFNRAGESKDPIPTLIPMSWDQRHTFNVTVGYNAQRFGITLTGYYNSGTPFSWIPISENRVANINFYPNNAYQKSAYSVDMNGYIDLYKYKNIALRLNYSVYNLFDCLNEYWVDATTGRAYTSIIRPSDESSHISDFNEYVDTVQNPSMYSAPRLIKIGLGVSF